MEGILRATVKETQVKQCRIQGESSVLGSSRSFLDQGLPGGLEVWEISALASASVPVSSSARTANSDAEVVPRPFSSCPLLTFPTLLAPAPQQTAVSPMPISSRRAPCSPSPRLRSLACAPVRSEPQHKAFVSLWLVSPTSPWWGSSRTTQVHFLPRGTTSRRRRVVKNQDPSLLQISLFYSTCVLSTGENFGKIIATKQKTWIPSMLCFLTGLDSLMAFCLTCQRLVSVNIWPRKATMGVTLYRLGQTSSRETAVPWGAKTV